MFCDRGIKVFCLAHVVVDPLSDLTCSVTPEAHPYLQSTKTSRLLEAVNVGMLRQQRSGERQSNTVYVRLFQPKLAIVLLDNPVAFTGGVFKFLAIHDLHCATGVLDDLLLLQNTRCRAHGGSIRA